MSATPESPVLHACCMTAVLCNDHPQLQHAAVLSFLLQLPISDISPDPRPAADIICGSMVTVTFSRIALVI